MDKNTPFAVFDFDGTCIENDIEEASLAYICEHRFLKNTSLLPFENKKSYCKNVFLNYFNLLDKKQNQKAYLFAARAFAGFSKKELKEIVAKTLASEGKIVTSRVLFGRTIAKGICLKTKTKEMIAGLLEKKVKVYIVSASLEELVINASEQLNISPKPLAYIGIKMQEKNGILGDLPIPPFSMYEGKVECIKKYISSSEKPIIAVGDSRNDDAMLAYAKTALRV